MVPPSGMIALMSEVVFSFLLQGAAGVRKFPFAPVSAMKGVGGLERDSCVL